MKQYTNIIRWHIVWWMFTLFAIPVTCCWTIVYYYNKVMLQKRKFNLQGKVVLITGASSGLGEALAQIFYSYGCKLILVSRRKQELERVKETLLKSSCAYLSHEPIILPLDITEIYSLSIKLSDTLEVHKKLDILINNAGISYRGEVNNTEIEIDMKIMLTNYFGAIALTKTVLPWMIKQQSGCIICISSVQGKIATPYRSAYTASKHALQAWCDSARAELCLHNIKLITVNPGYIHTSLSLNALTNKGEKHGVMDETTRQGYSPIYVAEKVLNAMLKGNKEVIISSLKDKIAILVRTLFPSLFFWIIHRRAVKVLKK